MNRRGKEDDVYDDDSYDNDDDDDKKSDDRDNDDEKDAAEKERDLVDRASAILACEIINFLYYLSVSENDHI